MAAQIDPSTLPPFESYSMSGIWISTMLYGINVILYALCMYILVHKQDKAKKQWPLLATSTLLYVLATLHIAASFKQLMDCFVRTPDPNNLFATRLFWIDFTTPMQKLKGYTYTLIDTTQDLVLVWRVYVVWGNNWLLALIPFCIEMAHFGIAFYETYLSSTANGIQFTSKLPLIAYVLVIIVNVGCTAGIGLRLWYMGRRHSSSSGGGMGNSASWSSSGTVGTNRYLAPIFTIVESGAIFTLSSCVLLAMFVNDDARLQTSVNVATQLACLTPLLIIVRVGFGLTHGAPASSSLKKNVFTNPHVSFGRRTGSTGITSSSGTGTTVSAINVFRTVETDGPRSEIGTYKDDSDSYAMDDMKDGPSPFGRAYTTRTDV